MADVKVTKMVIKVVNLQCSKCYRKIKKVLCHYPEIRDQVYDEKKNTVTITVVCCSPENIKQKIACKAGDIVVSIEIVPAQKPKPDPTPPPPETRPTPTPPPSHCGRPSCKRSGPTCHDGCGQPSCKRSGPTCHDGCERPPCKCSGPTCHDGCERSPCKCSDDGCGRPRLCKCSDDGCGRQSCKCSDDGCGRPSWKCSGLTCHDGCGRPSCQCSGGNRDCYVSSCSEYFSEDCAWGCCGM